MKYVAIVLGIAVLTLSVSTDLLAQQRRFVSGSGSDANPCSLASPCRSLQVAITAVLPGGEVVPLDSAGYGAMTITKAVSIVTPPGVIASITASSGNAVTVSTGANEEVILRGLSISGLNSGVNGIVWTGGEALVLDSVSISGFTGDGVQVTADELLVINDSTIGGNGVGVRLSSATEEGLFASLNRVNLIGNFAEGLRIDSGDVFATIKDSVVVGNTNGLQNNATSSRMDVENCIVTFSDAAGLGGLSAGVGLGNIWLSNSTVTNNVLGIGSGVLTRLNNSVEGNQTNGSFEGPFSAK